MSRLVNYRLGCDDIIASTVPLSLCGSRAHVASDPDHGLPGPVSVARVLTAGRS